MAVYYNEFDPGAASWLRELIKRQLIPDGEVDERSITEVSPSDLTDFVQCHFFAGIGGWPYSLRLAGWPDDHPVWTGSCPCQPFSMAGKRRGFGDERHLWPVFHELIRQCQPDVCMGEQVSSKEGLVWLDTVCSDLEADGYACAAVDACAAGHGAPHIRQRLYWVGYKGEMTFQSDKDAPEESASNDLPELDTSVLDAHWQEVDWLFCRDGRWRPVEPGTFPLVQHSPARVQRLRGYGNAIVPPQAAMFIQSFMDVVSNSNNEIQ